MLERMDDFFSARVNGYDEHMRDTIEGSDEFYDYTASLLPGREGAVVLDLGCGTGLELEAYFAVNPSASVTGIDLTQAMLDTLKEKFPGKDLKLICGSYFDEPFGKSAFDAAVSVESLHHFTKEEKIPLYTKLCASLKDGGYFILTDYFSKSEDEEKFFRQRLDEIKKEEGIRDDEFYHYDTPLTVEHEKEALLAAGFKSVEMLKNWDATYTLKAER